MLNIMITNPKGGCGKTTIATHLAAWYSRQGEITALADYDKQGSSLNWLKARQKSELEPIVAINCYGGEEVPVGVDVVIHDMPAVYDISELKEFNLDADKVILPILPSPADIRAASSFLMNLAASSWYQEKAVDIAFVANRSRTNTNAFKELDSFLSRLTMPFIGSLRDTQNYVRVISNGTSVFDLPNWKAKNDIDQWEPIIKWLN